MASASLLYIAALLLVTSLFSGAVEAANFTCNATKTAACKGLIEYVPANATNYTAVQSLFQVPALLSLLGANNLDPTTPPTRAVPAGSAVRIPFPCACANGTGASNRTPVYTVKAGDGLDDIAREHFGALVTYQDITVANGLPNSSLITPGQKLWIPLPCSCDPVGGRAVVHLGHVVASGSSVAGIAAEFGTDEATLLGLNGITDPKKLLAGQLLDVPLQVCSSSISSSSVDHNLLVPNGTYSPTANNCVICSCNSSQTTVDCRPTQALSSSVCPAAKCGNLDIGNTSTSGCDVTTCAYAGYTNATSLTILTNTTTQSTCSNGGATRLGSKASDWTELFFLFHIALLALCFM